MPDTANKIQILLLSILYQRVTAWNTRIYKVEFTRTKSQYLHNVFESMTHQLFRFVNERKSNQFLIKNERVKIEQLTRAEIAFLNEVVIAITKKRNIWIYSEGCGNQPEEAIWVWPTSFQKYFLQNRQCKEIHQRPYVGNTIHPLSN